MHARVTLVVHWYVLMMRTNQFYMVQFHMEEYVQPQINLEHIRE